MVTRLQYDTLSVTTVDVGFLRSLLRLGADINSRFARLDSVSEIGDFSEWEMTPYGLCVTLAVDVMGCPGNAAKDLLRAVMQTGVTPHGRILFGIQIGPKGAVLMGGHASARKWKDLNRHGYTGKHRRFQDHELIFVVASSLAFLLEVVRFRLFKHMTAADMEVGENSRLGAGTSCNRDICVSFVRICESPLWTRVVSTWRIADRSIRADMASLFRRWLLPGDDSWKGMDEELIGVGHMIKLDMNGRPEAYERVDGSVTHVFGAEECCSSRGRDVDGDLRTEDGGL